MSAWEGGTGSQDMYLGNNYSENSFKTYLTAHQDPMGILFYNRICCPEFYNIRSRSMSLPSYNNICCSARECDMYLSKRIHHGIMFPNKSFVSSFAAVRGWRIAVSASWRLHVCFIPRLRHHDRRRRKRGKSMRHTLHVACVNHVQYIC